MKIYLKKTIIILIILLSPQITTCKLQASKTNNIKYNLLLNFKKNAKLDYISTTKVRINNIRFIGVKKNIKNIISSYTNNKKLISTEFSIKRNFTTAVIKLYRNGSADTKTTMENYVVNKIKLNQKPLFTKPYNISIPKTSPIKIKHNEKGKVIKIYKDDKTDNTSKLLENIISILNKYQQLPNKHITIGDSWSNQINEYIPIAQLTSNKIPWIKGYIAIKLIIINTLKNVKANKIYINFKAKGQITLKSKTIDGKNSINIKIENVKGNTILNNKIGLTESANITNNIRLKLRLNHKKIGNPIIKASIKIIHKLNYTP